MSRKQQKVLIEMSIFTEKVMPFQKIFVLLPPESNINELWK